MDRKMLLIAADFLDRASDEFSNHGCNDWDFPADWSLEEKQTFVKAAYEANGDPENYNPDAPDLPDWWVMRILADHLREAAQR